MRRVPQRSTHLTGERGKCHGMRDVFNRFTTTTQHDFYEPSESEATSDASSDIPIERKTVVRNKFGVTADQTMRCKRAKAKEIRKDNNGNTLMIFFCGEQCTHD
ncbi:hypothetical protein SARC_07396 [Sphaeroforma arctica JP610]|uniref:Uncharacterized protein n=1 Tax=Sphaeroforma arctica JP610 TaxID=667725 RepID=A0A0L0FWB4_9EUKA|nr:hypothetical protein SARC_07396 [Sphaeroforma arctica JP610]KNC80243.1 hypothetical protein SARC_07396 [Sphaeroforma arctica JP610]|eukprot:XP_014154145.1 hypothetical protein SARC_07396 [Sphaeroforma arctica JP610]